MALVKHVVLSSAPVERGALVRALFDSPAGLTTSAVGDLLKVSAPTARKFMRTLALLDIGTVTLGRHPNPAINRHLKTGHRE
jgi:hypothetical protein